MAPSVKNLFHSMPCDLFTLAGFGAQFAQPRNVSSGEARDRCNRRVARRWRRRGFPLSDSGLYELHSGDFLKISPAQAHFEKQARKRIDDLSRRRFGGRFQFRVIHTDPKGALSIFVMAREIMYQMIHDIASS
jgi:hypothetical protein